jgi:alpha-glucosidase
MLLNMGLSGFAFAGVDIGGFSGNTDAELLLRWYQTGIFYPFFRNHCALGQRAQEPWAFGAKVERAIRKLICTRYSLTRYIEMLFVEHRETGAPLMRPLCWHYPDDPHATSVDDEFLFGQDLLVAPILKRAATERVVYFPAGIWEPFDGGSAVRGPCHRVVRWDYDQIPAFIRHGAVLPLVAPAQHMSQLERKLIVLRCYGSSGRGRLWLDDGHSLAYERGHFDDFHITFAKANVKLRAAHLGYSRRPKYVSVEIAGHSQRIELPTR